MFTIAAGLAVFGSVMVYSASAMMSLKETQDETDLTYFYKQFAFTIAGILLMIVVSRVDYKVLDNAYVVYTAIGLTVVLLLAGRELLAWWRPAFPVVLTPGTIAQTAAAAVVMALLAAWLPTRRLAQMDAASAFRSTR